MKKVLYVASTNSHLLNFHLPYIKYLSENGYEVISAGSRENIPIPHCAKSVYIPFRKSIFSLGNIGCVFRLRKLIKQEKIDIISVHTALAAALVRLSIKLMKNRPLVINTVHGYLFGTGCSKRKNSVLLSVEKILRKQTDSIVVMNSEDFAIATENKLALGRIEKIDGMGINAERFLYSERDSVFRSTLGFAENDKVMVFAGEFSDRKNQSFLINALSKLPDNYKLLLLGKGAMLDECKALCKTLGVEKRVVFAGYISDVERYYAISDICVSASKIEGMPFGIIEAMAAGLPLVLSDIKGQRDLVTNEENGSLYTLNSTEEFISAVKRVSESGFNYKAANRKASAKYTLDTVFEHNMDLYLGLMK